MWGGGEDVGVRAGGHSAGSDHPAAGGEEVERAEPFRSCKVSPAGTDTVPPVGRVPFGTRQKEPKTCRGVKSRLECAKGRPTLQAFYPPDPPGFTGARAEVPAQLSGVQVRRLATSHGGLRPGAAVSVRSYTPMGCLHWHGHGAFPSIGEPGGQLLPAAKPGGRLGAKGCRHSAGTRPEAAEGTAHTVVSCPPENYRRALTERGVHRGFSPYAHSLVTFSCGREGHQKGESREFGGGTPQMPFARRCGNRRTCPPGQRNSAPGLPRALCFSLCGFQASTRSK